MTTNNMLNGKKVGLVLGCGAVAGAAWSVPILQQLQQQLDWDARNADVLIGTSVGAVLAALLSAAVSVETLAASLRSEQCNSNCTWDHDTSWGHWYPPLPGLTFSGLPLLQKGWRGEVAPLTAVCGALPAGRFDMTPFRQLINAHVPEGQWSPHPDCWIMAVDNATGDRVAFGRPMHHVPVWSMRFVHPMPCRAGVHRCRLLAAPGWMVVSHHRPQRIFWWAVIWMS
ncbi:MAG: hypothetical protein R3F47_12695 [Gammaproteobacteria bacterium]